MQKSVTSSKAMWGGALVVLGGVATAVGLFLQGQLDFNGLMTQVAPLVGTGLGIIGVRHAQG